MKNSIKKPIENDKDSNISLVNMLGVTKNKIKDIMWFPTENNNAKKLLPVISKNMAISRSWVDHVLVAVYSRYEEKFADVVARLVIKRVFDHMMKFWQYDTLNGLLSSKYINEKEKQMINDNLNKCALNYINQHSGWIMQESESLYDFDQLVKLLSLDYISEEVKVKVEEILLKRAKNKKEPFLNDIVGNKDIPEYIKAEANVVLEKLKQKWIWRHLKPEISWV